MRSINKKFIDSVLPPQRRSVSVAPVQKSHVSATLRQVGKFLMVSKVSLLIVLMMSVVPLTAFEAHVINVTATIERKQCTQYEVQSKGFWKTHEEFWIFPQTLGPDTIATSTDAVAVFDASNSSMRNKLKKQLLALKFNIAYYGAGSAFVPNEATTTLSDLVAQADALLSQDPPPLDSTLEAMKDRIESVNIAGKVSTCPPPPPPPGGTCNKDDPPPHDPKSQDGDDEDNNDFDSHDSDSYKHHNDHDNNNHEGGNSDKKDNNKNDTSNEYGTLQESRGSENNEDNMTPSPHMEPQGHSFASLMTDISTTTTTEITSTTTQSDAWVVEIATSTPTTLTESTSTSPIVAPETSTTISPSNSPLSPPPQDAVSNPPVSDTSVAPPTIP